MIEGIDLPNREKIRILGKKETYKYLGTLEADTIKHPEIKETIEKRIPLENEETTRNQTT